MNPRLQTVRRTIAAVGILAALARAGTTPSPASLPSDTEIRQILLDRIDVQHKSVGIVVGIISAEGRRVVSYGQLDTGDSRPVNGDTVFEIGSLTKIFTSLLLADMVTRGEVSLSDPVSKFLPGVKLPERAGRSITLLDLATQTSGLPFWPSNFPSTSDAEAYSKYSADQLFDFLATYELPRDIGSQWSYSNLGMGLLGMALSHRAGKDYESLVRERITAPLGMENTAITLRQSMKLNVAVGHETNLHPAPDWNVPLFAGASSLRSSVNDMLKFLATTMGYVKSPLQPAIALMLETRRPAPLVKAEQALGWWVIGQGDDQVMAHGGRTFGYASYIAWDAKTRIGVVALSNAVITVQDIVMHLLRPEQPLAKAADARAHTEIALDPRLFDSYAGQYRTATGLAVAVERQGEALMIQLPSAPKLRLHPETERDFFIAESDLQVTFQTDARGGATSVIVHYSGKDIPATRVQSASATR
jgi:CubicO group peptidase (beta-lactamase class C family)